MQQINRSKLQFQKNNTEDEQRYVIRSYFDIPSYQPQEPPATAGSGEGSSHMSNYQLGEQVLVQQYDELGLQEYEYPDQSHQLDYQNEHNFMPQEAQPHQSNPIPFNLPPQMHAAPSQNYHPVRITHHAFPIPHNVTASVVDDDDEDEIQDAKNSFTRSMSSAKRQLQYLRATLGGAEWQRVGEVLFTLLDLDDMFHDCANNLALERFKAQQIKEQLHRQWQHIAQIRYETDQLHIQMRSNFAFPRKQVPEFFAGGQRQVDSVPVSSNNVQSITKQSSSEFGYNSDDTTAEENSNNTSTAAMSINAAPFIPNKKK